MVGLPERSRKSEVASPSSAKMLAPDSGVTWSATRRVTLPDVPIATMVVVCGAPADDIAGVCW
jgi:hypothetical protein